VSAWTVEGKLVRLSLFSSPPNVPFEAQEEGRRRRRTSLLFFFKNFLERRDRTILPVSNHNKNKPTEPTNQLTDQPTNEPKIMRTSSTVVTVNFADFTCIHGFGLAMVVMTVMAWASSSNGGGGLFSSFDRREDVVRVAMVGNSMMYYNDLPRLLEAMSGGRLQQDSCLHGDASLESHLVYGNGMLDIWTNGQARMWDVDEKEAAKEDYYDVYSPYYYYNSNSNNNNDDASASANDDDDGDDDDGSSSSSSSSYSSSSSSQTVDSSYIYDYGACTVEQLLLGYDNRFDEIYEEEANQYYYYYYYNNNNDDDDDNNANNNNNDNNDNNRRRRRRDKRKNRTRRRMKKRRSKRRRNFEQQQQQQQQEKEEENFSFRSLRMNNNTSFPYSFISSSSSSSSSASSSSSSWSQRSRDRQQKDLFQQLSGTTRRQKNHDDQQQRANQQQQQQQQRQQLYDSKLLRDHRRISNWSNWRSRRAEEEDAAGANDAEGNDDMVAVDDDQAAADADEDENANGDGYDDNANVNDDGNAAAVDDDDANSNANNNNNADDDNYDEDDAYYAYTDDDSTEGAISYDDDYYQDTYDEKYPLEDDGMNPCLASANYYFFKQRQYDDFGPPQWDYVLINDNTRSPCCTDQRATSLELLDDVYVPWLRETKAVPIFMVTHSYWSSIRDMSGVTDVPTFLSLTYEGYREYAETVGKALPANQQPKIAPVGLAFLLVWEENRSLWYNLIHQDEIHLTPTGTFLEGLIVYSTIYGHLPSPTIVLSGEVANLFSNARRMTPSEHIQEYVCVCVCVCVYLLFACKVSIYIAYSSSVLCLFRFLAQSVSDPRSSEISLPHC